MTLFYQAYLNGDGLGKAKCLSLLFVLMRGEYDELLHFPFKQRVVFSLLCPSNPSLSKHETFLVSLVNSQLDLYKVCHESSQFIYCYIQCTFSLIQTAHPSDDLRLK